MSDIYTEPKLIERRWKTRAKKIVIVNPPNETDEQKQIIFDVETVPYDNNIPSFDQSQQKQPLKINLMDVITNTFTVFDPITRQNVTISTAGIASAIEAAFVDWTLNK